MLKEKILFFLDLWLLFLNDKEHSVFFFYSCFEIFIYLSHLKVEPKFQSNAYFFH